MCATLVVKNTLRALVWNIFLLKLLLPPIDPSRLVFNFSFTDTHKNEFCTPHAYTESYNIIYMYESLASGDDYLNNNNIFNCPCFQTF